MSQTTEQKLDALIKAVNALTDNQRKISDDQRRISDDQRKISENQIATQHDLDEKFKKLEGDVAASQEDATERALKRAKRDRPLEFRKKGHEEQYLFNAEISDRIESAAKKIKKITAPSEKDAKVAQDALDELHEGILALAERQKHIRIADQAKNSWRAVALYKAGGLGDSKEDNDKIKQADKEAELDGPQSRRESLPDKQRKIPVSHQCHHWSTQLMVHSGTSQALRHRRSQCFNRLPQGKGLWAPGQVARVLIVFNLVIIGQIVPGLGGHSILLSMMYVYAVIILLIWAMLVQLMMEVVLLISLIAILLG